MSNRTGDLRMRKILLTTSLIFSVSVFSANHDKGLDFLKQNDIGKAQDIFKKDCYSSNNQKSCFVYGMNLKDLGSSLEAIKVLKDSCYKNYAPSCHHYVIAHLSYDDKDLYNENYFVLKGLLKKACKQNYKPSCRLVEYVEGKTNRP